MKIYAYTLPHDATKSGWIKIGQASDSDKRIKEQIGATRMHYEKIFDQSALAGKRNVSDHDVHRLLTEKGFQRGEGEWFRCTPEDVQAALDFLKEKYISEDKRSDLSQKFYEELRNWYYWATEEQYQGIFAEREPDPDHALRIIVRLLLCFFLREKELVPKEIFDEDWIHENLKVNEFRYYEAILRNLFFYSLNTPEHKRGELENRKFILHYNKVKDVLHHSIPFLNGGLFNEHPGDDFALNNLYFFSEKHSKPIKALDGMFPVMGIVKILSQYKYTLDETDNSEMIDPEFIGKIFECLLACIDADSQESQRKVTGSYYTPREVVDYMVSEALNAFRESSTASAEDLLRCKILDPSCGSGAFPCGIMNEMMRRFDPDKTLSQEERYTKKLEILRNVIYGVDIQPMAVQIAIFRLFLSLLQEIVPDKRKPNFGIEPLPNLEYKFVCADTLMGIKGNGDFFAENQSEFDHIRLLKMDYFQKNNAAEKEKLKHRIENIEMGIAAQFQKDVADFQKQIDDLEAEITEMSHESLQDGKVREARLENLQKRLTQSKARLQKMISTEALSALCKWNHFDTEPAPYFDSRWMFGIEKFDIIIGNPPYIGEDDHKAIFEPYKETEIGKRFYKGKMDMFYFFFHRALDILPQGGLALFISTNYWTTADGACKLREDIFNRSEVLSIVNFNQCKVFQTAQGQHNMITVLRRTDTPQNNLTKQVIVNVKSGFNPDLIKQILKGLNPDTVYTTFERKKLFDGNKHYIRFSAGDKMDALLDKIAKKGKPLGDKFQTNQGVVPGAMVFSNDLRRRFTAIQAEKDAPIFVYPKGMLQTMMGERPDLIKPFYKNSDIQRYFSATETDKELLYADGKTELPPKILKYLRKFKKILKLRRECEEGKIEWWELHWSRTPELFLRPKIVLPYRTYEATFAYNEIPFYAATDVYYITQEKDDKTLLKALLGILNSKLIYTWLYHRGKRKGNMLELFPTILQQIPLVFPKDLKPLVNLVEQRLKLSDASAMCKAVECKIDEFVYELYGLTQEEIAVIEKKG